MKNSKNIQYNNITIYHKTLIAMLAVVLMLLPLGGVRASVAPRTLIKGSSPAVYYVGDNGSRYVFPNDKIYFSWFNDFSGVKTVSDAELATYPLGGNIYYRPGTRLVKIESDPKVYAVAPQGLLYWVASESAAARLYGANWARRVDDLSAAFFGDYFAMGELDGTEHPAGTLIKYSGTSQIYLLVDESGTIQRRPVGSAAFTAMRYKNENVLEISASFTYPESGAITSADTQFSDAGQFAFSRPTGVTIVRGDSGSRVLDRTSSAAAGLMKISITTEEDITIQNLAFRIEALTNQDEDNDPGGLVRGNNSYNVEPNLANFILDQNGTQKLGPASLGLTNDKEQKIYLAGNFSMSAKQNAEFWVKAKIDADCPIGEKFRIYLLPGESTIKKSNGQQATDVTPSGELASGDMEVQEGAAQINLGNNFSGGDLVGGGSLVSVASFYFLTTGGSDVTVSRIALTGYVDENEGNADFAQGSDSDNGSATTFATIVPMLYLYDGTTKIAGPLNTDTSGYYIFDNFSWNLAAGESRTITVKGDISVNAPFETYYDRIALDINNVDSDISASAGGQSVKISGSRPNGGATPNVYLNVRNNGILTFTNVAGVPEKSIMVAGEGKQMAAYTVKADYEDIRIDRLAFLNPTPSADDCIMHVDLGWSNSAGASGTKRAYVSGSLADYQSLGLVVPKGGTANISLTLQTKTIADGCDSGDKPSLNLALNEQFEAWGLYSSEIFDTTRINRNDYVKNSTAANNYVVMRKTRPTVSFDAGNPSGDATRGATEVLRFTIAAAVASADNTTGNDLKIKKLTFKITTDDVGQAGNDNDLLEHLADINGDFTDDDGVIDFYDRAWPDTLIGEGGSGNIKYSIYDASASGLDSTPAGIESAVNDYAIVTIEFPYGGELTIPSGGIRTFSLELDTVGLHPGRHNLRVDLLGDTGEGISNFWWNDNKQDASGYLVNYLPLSGREMRFY